MQTTPQVSPREAMLKNQLLTNGMRSERVMQALMAVDRSAFAPDNLQHCAYVDEELPLGGGRFLMEPRVFAKLLEHAALQEHETVLDVAVANGYSSAVLSHLVKSVVACEEDQPLFNRARMLLAQYPTVLLSSLSTQAPDSFDVIIIEGAIQQLPIQFEALLKEGGRLYTIEQVAPAHPSTQGLGKLVEYKKIRGKLSRLILADASVSLLPQFRITASFAL